MQARCKSMVSGGAGLPLVKILKLAAWNPRCIVDVVDLFGLGLGRLQFLDDRIAALCTQ